LSKPEAKVPQSVEDLKNRTPDELEAMVKVLDAQIRALHLSDNDEIRTQTEDEKKAFKLLLDIRNAAIDMIDEHRSIMEVFNRRPKSVEVVYKSLANDELDQRRLTNSEARDRALKLVEKEGKYNLDATQMTQLEKHVRNSADIARRTLVTENEQYRSAWMKLVSDPQPFLSPEEIRAVEAWKEYRVASEGTTTAGGFGIPVFIDPSIILTAQGSGNPFLSICRQATVNTNAWKGINSAGVSWSFDAEGAAVSDDAVGDMAQPTVTVFMARGFIPYSIEVGQDYPDFAGEMARLLAEGYDELLVDKFSRGSGSGEPRGILTALDANTNDEVVSTTDGAFGQEDIYKVWKALPQRFRRNASWMMSVDVNNKIRQFGTANVFHAFTQNLPAEWADTLFGKAVYESPYFPDMTGTTGAENRLVVGDFSNYLIARRGGMSVELLPLIVDVTNNRPTGQRGWFAYARIGGNSVNDLGFRLLQNQ
jgi:HK97 family phage major capsid protein